MQCAKLLDHPLINLRMARETNPKYDQLQVTFREINWGEYDTRKQKIQLSPTFFHKRLIRWFGECLIFSKCWGVCDIYRITITIYKISYINKRIISSSVAHGRYGARDIHELGRQSSWYKQLPLVEESINSTREQAARFELRPRADRVIARSSLYDYHEENGSARGSDSSLSQNAVLLRKHLQSWFDRAMVRTRILLANHSIIIIDMYIFSNGRYNRVRTDSLPVEFELVRHEVDKIDELIRVSQENYNWNSPGKSLSACYYRKEITRNRHMRILDLYKKYIYMII